MVEATSWCFRAPVHLAVGRGVRRELADAWPMQWIVVSSRRGRGQVERDPWLRAAVTGRVVRWVDDVRANPQRDWLRTTAERLRPDWSESCAFLAIGGGSAIDAAKALAAMVAVPPRVSLDMLIDDPRLLSSSDIMSPIVAVATTAGSGSEVTPFATVWDATTGVKASLSHPRLWPESAFVDADLMDGLPYDVTLATGLDALNQAAESTWSRRASHVSLELAGRALEVGLPALSALAAAPGAGGSRAEPIHAITATSVLDPRAAMADASSMAGLAIAHTRTALCHAISYPITARFGVPHGVACAFTMAAVARHVAPADDGRLTRLAMRLGLVDADALAACFDELLRLTGVSAWVREEVGSLDALLRLRPAMATPGRADNALRHADTSDLGRILTEAWMGGPA